MCLFERGASLGKERNGEWDLSSELWPIATEQRDADSSVVVVIGSPKCHFSLGKWHSGRARGPTPGDAARAPMLLLEEPVGVACPSLSGDEHLSTPMHRSAPDKADPMLTSAFGGKRTSGSPVMFDAVNATNDVGLSEQR